MRLGINANVRVNVTDSLKSFSLQVFFGIVNSCSVRVLAYFNILWIPICMVNVEGANISMNITSLSILSFIHVMQVYLEFLYVPWTTMDTSVIRVTRFSTNRKLHGRRCHHVDQWRYQHVYLWRHKAIYAICCPGRQVVTKSGAQGQSNCDEQVHRKHSVNSIRYSVKFVRRFSAAFARHDGSALRQANPTLFFFRLFSQESVACDSYNSWLSVTTQLILI